VVELGGQRQIQHRQVTTKQERTYQTQCSLSLLEDLQWYGPVIFFSEPQF
jgi:hypothetical protein